MHRRSGYHPHNISHGSRHLFPAGNWTPELVIDLDLGPLEDELSDDGYIDPVPSSDDGYSDGHWSDELHSRDSFGNGHTDGGHRDSSLEHDRGLNGAMPGNTSGRGEFGEPRSSNPFDDHFISMEELRQCATSGFLMCVEDLIRATQRREVPPEFLYCKRLVKLAIIYQEMIVPEPILKRCRRERPDLTPREALYNLLRALRTHHINGFVDIGGRRGQIAAHFRRHLAVYWDGPPRQGSHEHRTGSYTIVPIRRDHGNSRMETIRNSTRTPIRPSHADEASYTDSSSSYHQDRRSIRQPERTQRGEFGLGFDDNDDHGPDES